MTSPDAQVKKANRRSAVERLEESKANYVKTERVLDRKQEFEHSATLHISTRPQIDVLLRAPIKSYYNAPNALQRIHNLNQSEHFDPSAGKRNSFRSCNIFDAKSKPQKKDSQLTNKKCSRNYDYCGVQHPDGEKRMKTASSIPLVYEGLAELGKDPTVCRNDFLQQSKDDFPTRYWGDISSTTREKNVYALDTESLSNHEESEGEAPSTDDTRDSLSTGDAMEYEDKYHDSKTSDYASRSSSFKCLVPSDRVRNLVNRFESQCNKNATSPIPKINAQEKRKPVSRSKSDVSHRFSKGFTVAQEKKLSNDIDLERFFNTMGLDTASWKNLASPPRSPAHFFDSISSLNSDDHLSSICSEGSGGEVVAAKEGLRNQDLRRHAPAETSIVEKNARVVKWLYNCYNARKAFNP